MEQLGKITVMHRITPLIAATAFLVFNSPYGHAADATAAEFAVTDNVVQKQVTPSGFNLEIDLYRPWVEPPKINVWSPLPNPEPIEVRMKGVASGGGDTYLEDAFIPGKDWGLSFFNTARDGFYDGGTVQIVRITDGKAQVVRTATIKSSESGEASSPNRLTFTESGPAIQAGDEYIISVRRTGVSSANFRPAEINPAFRWWGFDPKSGSKSRMDLDDTTAAPEGGSTASFKVTFAGADNFETQWLSQKAAGLKSGAKYVFRAWMKQDGLPEGEVNLKLGSLAEQKLKVSGEWQLFEVEFEGAPPKTVVEKIALTPAGPGTLWIDNMLVYEKGKTAPFEFYPEAVENLKALKPGFVRIWALQTNKGFGGGLLAGIRNPWGAPLRMDERGAEQATAVSLHKLLEVTREVGAQPWIVTSTLFTVEEQKALMEYLAGPPDSPYGKLRAELGQTAPWTDVFSRILIEYGNEAWNPAFSPQNYTGRPEDYGAVAQLAFEAMASSPYFNKSKIGFVLNGWVTQTDLKHGFGPRAATTCPLASYVGVAPYIGGWDVAGTVAGGTDQTGQLELMMAARRLHAKAMNDAVEAVLALNAERTSPIQNVVYEGGPGYSLPAPGKPVNPVEEARGKSLATALSYFDHTLNNIALGFGPQQFYKFNIGDYWASHTISWQPHASTLGLKLLNEHAKGAMLETKTISTPTTDLPTTEIIKERVDQRTKEVTEIKRPLPAISGIPLVQCFAFRDGKTLSLAILSLQPSGDTKTTITLPAAPAGPMKKRTLNGPSALSTNIEAEEVKISDSEVTPQGQKIELDIPPHSLTVVSGKIP